MSIRGRGYSTPACVLMQAAWRVVHDRFRDTGDTQLLVARHSFEILCCAALERLGLELLPNLDFSTYSVLSRGRAVHDAVLSWDAP